MYLFNYKRHSPDLRKGAQVPALRRILSMYCFYVSMYIFKYVFYEILKLFIQHLFVFPSVLYLFFSYCCNFTTRQIFTLLTFAALTLMVNEMHDKRGCFQDWTLKFSNVIFGLKQTEFLCGREGIGGFGVAGQDIQRGPGISNLSHVTDFPGSDTWEYLPNCSKDAATAPFRYHGLETNRFVQCVRSMRAPFRHCVCTCYINTHESGFAHRYTHSISLQRGFTKPRNAPQHTRTHIKNQTKQTSDEFVHIWTYFLSFFFTTHQ